MKKFLSTLSVLTLCITLLPTRSAEAATMKKDPIPVEEPDHGFTLGQNPEWGQTHLEEHEDREDHRRYHAAMEKKNREWIDQWSDMQGSLEYMNAHREFRARLNFDHRMAHTIAAERHFRVSEPPAVFDRLPLSSIRKPVERKSRRLIKQEANQRMQENAAARKK